MSLAGQPRGKGALAGAIATVLPSRPEEILRCACSTEP